MKKINTGYDFSIQEVPEVTIYCGGGVGCFSINLGCYSTIYQPGED